MTTGEKLLIVQMSPELTEALQLLIASFKDCELKSHIRFTYTVNDAKYELTFMPIVNEITYKLNKQ